MNTEQQQQAPTAAVAAHKAKQHIVNGEPMAAANGEMQPASASEGSKSNDENQNPGNKQLAGLAATQPKGQVSAEVNRQADNLPVGTAETEVQIYGKEESKVVMMSDHQTINKSINKNNTEGKAAAKVEVTAEEMLLPSVRMEPVSTEKEQEALEKETGDKILPNEERRIATPRASEVQKKGIIAIEEGEQPVIGSTTKPAAQEEASPSPAAGDEYFVIDSLPETFRQDSLLANNTTKEADDTVVPVPEKTFLRGWTIGAYFTPRFAYRSVNPRGEDDVLVTQMNNPSRSGRERIGYEFGLSVLKAMGTRFSLESNIGILTQQNDLAYNYTNGEIASYERSALPGGGIQINPVLVHHDRQLSSKATYGNLRIGANWYFWQSGYRRLHLSVASGANLLLNHKTEEYLNGQLLTSSDALLRKSNYQLTLGLGYNRQIFSHWEMVAMPMLQYFLSNSFSEAVPVGVKPYTLGVQLQLRRSFF